MPSDTYCSSSSALKDVNDDLSDRYKTCQLESNQDCSIVSNGPAGNEQIYDLLVKIDKDLREHHDIAATKTDIKEQSISIVEQLNQQNEELKNALEELKHHLDLFSIRKIAIVIALICIAICSILIFVTIFMGRIVLNLPLLCLFLIVFACFYFMARKLPNSI